MNFISEDNIWKHSKICSPSKDLERYACWYQKTSSLKRPKQMSKVCESLDWTNIIDQHVSVRIANPYIKPLSRALNSNASTYKWICENEKDKLFIDEALIKTYNVEALLKHLKSICKKSLPREFADLTFGQTGWKDEYKDQRYLDWHDVGQQDPLGIAYNLTFRCPVLNNESNITDLTKKLVQGARLCGYEVTDVQMMDVKEQPTDIEGEVKILQIDFEAKYTEFNVQLSDVMYHTAPTHIFNKIKKNGLVPKSASKHFYYDDRIYLFNKKMMTEIAQYGVFKTIESNRRNQFCIFKVDGKKIRESDAYKSGKWKFYADLSFSDIEDDEAVFTYQNISRDYLLDEVLLFEIEDKAVKSDSLKKLSLSKDKII